jgi:transcriptional regulator with XRE-family HTH domain
MTTSLAEAAFAGVLADLDGERFDRVIEILAEDAELADELTGVWLHGRERVAAYLTAQQGVVTKIRSRPSDITAHTLAPDLTLVTAFIDQRYLLDGEERREALSASVIFREVDGTQQLRLFHLGQTGTRTLVPLDGVPAVPATAVDEPAPLGERLRAQRRRAGLSLRELARQAELSPSFLSQIERDQAEPSVQSLRRLCEALRIDVADLFGDADPDPQRRLTRSSQRSSTTLAGAGFSVHPFAALRHGVLEASIVEIAPGGAVGDLERPWPGEQFVYVLAGSAQLQNGPQVSELGVDDGCFVAGRHALQIRCAGDQPTRILLLQDARPR